jgi:broad specificity phosphatase PhoE
MNSIDKLPWAKEALELLDSGQYLRKDLSSMLFIRHSQRLDSNKWDEIKLLRLTPEGLQAAFDFGMKIPKYDEYRIYYSQVERCKETAIEIRKALQSRKANVTKCEELTILGVYLGKSDEIGKLFTRDKKRFVNFWAANHYPTDIIEPLSDYAKKTAEIVWKIHANENILNQKHLDIFVTHDTTILGLEFGWCGVLRDTTKEWVDFLGGFWMQFYQTQIYLITRKKCFESYFPVWNPLKIDPHIE